MKAITNNILVQNGNICKPKSKKDVKVTKQKELTAIKEHTAILVRSGCDICL